MISSIHFSAAFSQFTQSCAPLNFRQALASFASVDLSMCGLNCRPCCCPAPRRPFGQCNTTNININIGQPPCRQARQNVNLFLGGANFQTYPGAGFGGWASARRDGGGDGGGNDGGGGCGGGPGGGECGRD